MLVTRWYDEADTMASLLVSVAGMLCRLGGLLTTLLFSSSTLAVDINGIWKHVENPVWIEVRIDQGDGIVVRNDKFPERVGDIFLKGLTADKTKQAVWFGTVYIHKLADYKKVEITLSDTGIMQTTGRVGFFSRTIEWLQVDKLPQ